MEVIKVPDTGPRPHRRLRRAVSLGRRGQKRPAEPSEDGPRCKKIRKSDPSEAPLIVSSNADDLPWKEVARPHEAGFDFNDEGGVLMLEEVDDVDVTYEEQAGGSRLVKFKTTKTSPKRAGARPRPQKASPDNASTSVRDPDPAKSQIPDEGLFDESLLPEWKSFELAAPIKRALHGLQFLTPTEIQRRALPATLEGKDVVGVAETGSGKTLAYGLPIIQSILASRSTGAAASPKRTISALVVVPTRELALQVCQHLRTIVEPADSMDKANNGQGKTHSPPLVSIDAVVGGMSVLKQKRVIKRGMDVMIATPGRLWDILSEDDDLASQIRGIQFLVLDEADRMIETGHFEELDNILKLTKRESADDVADAEVTAAFENAGMATVEHEGTQNDNMQTFVFSATLSKELQQNLKRRTKNIRPGRKRQQPASTLDDLILRLDFRDETPEVIDLSPEQGVSHTLQESKLDCLTAEKDLYLYYFLLRYPGRSLVFLSAIDGIRRLVPLLDLLGFKVFPLHSQLQQKQRLKNLDRFKSQATAVLLATDVAARGLDIPSVEHVIHYQIPRSADVYVHRSGRTARAEKPGFSLQLCGPEEARVQKALMQKLGRSAELPDLPVERGVLEKLKERIQLARKIDNAQHRIKKGNHDKNWLKEAAEALDIELDSDASDNVLSKDDKTASQIASYKAQLRDLLAQRISLRGISAKYVTSGSHPIADDLVSSSYHENMLGVRKSTAFQDVAGQATQSNGKHKSKDVVGALSSPCSWCIGFFSAMSVTDYGRIW